MKKQISRRRRMSYGIFASTLLTSLVIMVLVGVFTIGGSKERASVYINQKEVSGSNVQAVATSIAEEAKYKGDQIDIVLEYEGKTYPIKLDDIEVNSNIHTIVQDFSDRQYALDHKEQYLGAFLKTKRSYFVAIQYLFPGIDNKIDEIEKSVKVNPVNSEIIMKNGNIEVTPHQNGLAIDREKLYKSMTLAFYETDAIHLSLPMKQINPEITSEDNKQCCSIRSSFSTNVSDSTGNRKHNVRLALEKCNGLRVESGQQVSFNDLTGPHSAENGYKSAIIILKGKFTDGMGGGVCQASTTLYNALLEAGIEINEVSKHTLPVKYVPLALDAMVSNNSDLVFTNNLAHPITILTSATKDDVTVTIVGEDLGSVKYSTRSEVVKVLPHKGDQIIVDTKGEYSDKVLFVGEQYRLAYPRQGYEVEAFLEKYEDGKLVETKKIRHETYQPQQGQVVEGALEKPEILDNIDNQVETISAQEYEDVMAVPFEIESINTIPTNMCP